MMTLREAIEYFQYGDWYNHVQEGINQAEQAKLGDAIGGKYVTRLEALSRFWKRKWRPSHDDAGRSD